MTTTGRRSDDPAVRRGRARAAQEAAAATRRWDREIAALRAELEAQRGQHEAELAALRSDRQEESAQLRAEVAHLRGENRRVRAHLERMAGGGLAEPHQVQTSRPVGEQYDMDPMHDDAVNEAILSGALDQVPALAAQARNRIVRERVLQGSLGRPATAAELAVLDRHRPAESFFQDGREREEAAQRRIFAAQRTERWRQAVAAAREGRSPARACFAGHPVADPEADTCPSCGGRIRSPGETQVSVPAPAVPPPVRVPAEPPALRPLPPGRPNPKCTHEGEVAGPGHLFCQQCGERLKAAEPEPPEPPEPQPDPQPDGSFTLPPIVSGEPVPPEFRPPDHALPDYMVTDELDDEPEPGPAEREPVKQN